MIAKLFFLALVAAAQARPERNQARPHELCPPDMRHFLLPHEYDCTKFYYCEYGHKWDLPRDCAPGTHFSFELQVCVHPVQAGCTLPGVPPEQETTVGPTTPEPTTPEPTTPEPTTPEPTTPEPTTPEPTTPEPTTTTTTPEPTTTTTTPEPTTTTTTPEPTTTTTTPEPTTTTTTPEPTTTTTTPEPTTTTTTPEPTTTTTTPEPTTTTTTPEPTTTTTTPEPTTTTTTPEPTTTTTTPPPTTTTTTPEPTTTTTTPEPTTTTTTPEPTTTTTTPEPTTTTTTPEPTTTTTTPEPTTTTTTPEPTTTTTTPEPTTTTTTTPEPTTTTTTPEPSTTTAAPSTTTSAPTTESGATLPNGCPADFEIHQLLPHESNCTKFYYCNFGELVPRSCPPGLYFNPDLKVCDWPENVDCANSGNGNNSGENGNNSGENGNNSGENGNNSGENGNNSGENGNGNGNSNEDGDNGGVLDNGCPSDPNVFKLLPHESDCSKFYYCVNGNKVETECPGGLHFNPHIQVCDWPQNVNCGNNSGENGNGNENSNEDGNNSGENGNNGGENGNGNGNSNEDGDNGGVLENGCPTDPDVHKLLPHESDCSKFYYCVNGNKVETECPSGLHFNPIFQVCDWPQNVNCSNNGGENGNGNGNSNEDGNNSGENGNGNGNSNEDGDNGGLLENGCPADPDVHKLLPHESDCSKFYYCVNGKKVETECPSGLHFNPHIQVCDWPQNVNCGNNSGENGNGNENSNEDGNNSGENGNNGGENGNNSGENGNGNGNSNEDGDNGGVLENGCPADPDVHKLVPHESDCSKFYYCVNGNKVETECPSGLHFNPIFQVCDWPQNVNCSNNGGENGNGNGNSNEDGNNSGENGNNVGENGNGNGNSSEDGDNGGVLENGCPADPDVHKLLPHESDCSKFYYCVNGKKVETECPSGLHFNPHIQVCDWPKNVNCSNNGGENGNGNENSNEDGNNSGENGNSNGNSNEDGDNGGVLENGCPADPDVHKLLPHESDCRKFYYCVRGELVEKECYSGLYFNPDLQVCDWPQNVQCKNNNSSENGNSNEDGDNGGVLENGCPADPDVHKLLPHESDCSKFYYCVNGNKVETLCPSGLHFNPIFQVCDWPQNVNCSNSGNENSNENNTSGENGNGNGNSNEDGNNSGENGNGNGNSNEDGDNGGVLENGCPADPDVHKLLPHESDCSKFYYCVNGNKVETVCPSGLHFNPIFQVCDWPQNVNCSNSGNENSDENNTSGENGNGNGNSNEDGNNGGDNGNNSGEDGNNGGDNGNNSGEDGNSGENGNNSTEDNNNGGWLPNGCPADFDVHLLLPHESDCGKFYYCVFGQKEERKCDAPLHFNPTLQVCDWPQNAGCQNNGENGNNSQENGNNSQENGNNSQENGNNSQENGNNSQENGNNSQENGNNSQENGNNSQENGNNSQENGNNSGENGNGGEETEEGDHSQCTQSCNVKPWAHETACDKYWRCDGEKAVLVVCAEGLHFNAKSGTCDFICNANCVRDKVQTTADQQGLKIFVPWNKFDESMKDLIEA